MQKNSTKVDEKLLETIVQRILEVAQPEKIILFGSYARGDATEDSDIDILIIQPSDLPRYKRSTPIRLALRGLFPSKDIVGSLHARGSGRMEDSLNILHRICTAGREGTI